MVEQTAHQPTGLRLVPLLLLPGLGVRRTADLKIGGLRYPHSPLPGIHVRGVVFGRRVAATSSFSLGSVLLHVR